MLICTLNDMDIYVCVQTPRRRIDAAFSASASASTGTASWTPLAGSARGSKDHIELLISYILKAETIGGGGGSGGNTVRTQTISRASRMRRSAARMRVKGERPASASREAGRSQVPAFAGDPNVVADVDEVEPLRRFRLGVSYVSVKLSTTLPLETVRVSVTASLPRQLESLVIRAASRTDASLPATILGDATTTADDDVDEEKSLARSPARHQVRSRPAVDAFRGVEAILPRGELEVELEAGAVHLAALLAAGCRIVAKLWHEDASATPSRVLLGVCSIPLSQLLGGEMIEGYAPVIALEKGKQVEVARLRASLALEELGIVETRAAKRKLRNARLADVDEEVVDTHEEDKSRTRGRIGADEVQEETSVTEQQHHDAAKRRTEEAPRPVSPVPTPPAGSSQHEVDRVNTQVVPPSPLQQHQQPSRSRPHDHDLEASIREGREYAVAWELELWRQAEEAKFHAGLKNLESARLSSLESEFRRRDAARARDARAARAETESLRKKLAERLAEGESRETSLVQAEEKLSARSASLERMRTQGVHDAISGARRVQDEAEHAVRVETARATAAMHRAQAAEARAAELEHALDEARSKLASLVPDVAEVARLRAELALRDRAVAAAGRRVADALQAAKMWKSRYASLAERRRQEEHLHRNFGGIHNVVQPQRQQRHHNHPPTDESTTTTANVQLQEHERRRAGVERDGDNDNDQDEDVGDQDATPTKNAAAVENALEARRLIQERSALLLSGAYRERDVLIQKLDRKIAQLVPV